MIREITSEESFRKIKSNGSGYIAITDSDNRKLHIVNCSNVDLYYFKTKVILNNNKNGNYYWSDSISELKGKLSNIEECLHCKHLV